MSESPKAEHQKGADLRLQATDLQREMKKEKREKREIKKTAALKYSALQLPKHHTPFSLSQSLLWIRHEGYSGQRITHSYILLSTYTYVCSRSEFAIKDAGHLIAKVDAFIKVLKHSQGSII